MTPSQLERAARHYCKLMDLSPENVVRDSEGCWVKRWQEAAARLRSQWAMNEALKEGMRDPKVDAILGEMLGG